MPIGRLLCSNNKKMPCCARTAGDEMKPKRHPPTAQAVRVVQKQPRGARAADSAAAAAAAPLPKHLLRAAKDNDAERAGELLEQGINIEHVGMWGNTPLVCACAYASADVAALLVRRGANCAAVNDDGATPLMLACLEGLEEAVGLMLAPGVLDEIWPAAATVYSQAVDGSSAQTPLRAACEAGHLAVVKLLVQRGALAAAPSPTHVASALVAAARWGREDVVRTLLDAGVAAEEPDENGVTATQCATVEVQDLLAAARKPGQTLAQGDVLAGAPPPTTSGGPVDLAGASATQGAGVGAGAAAVTAAAAATAIVTPGQPFESNSSGSGSSPKATPDSARAASPVAVRAGSAARRQQQQQQQQQQQVFVANPPPHPRDGDSAGPLAARLGGKLPGSHQAELIAGSTVGVH
jgi:ankyrin repeat protein